MKYIKKAIPVDAWQIDLLELQHQGNYPDWVHNAMQPEYKIFPDIHKKHITIKTLEGHMIGHEGDYLIKGVKGELYPCRKDIFEETYEAYEEKPIHWKGGKIETIRVVENEDGSANIIMDMDEDVKQFFAAEGVKRVLRDAVENLAEKEGIKI
jgi:hypothetical protein